MSFNYEALTQNLKTLPRLHRIAFAASCCERLLPNYKKFAEDVDWGDYDTFRYALDEVWKFIEEKTANPKFFKDLAKKCELWIPDTENFDSQFTSAALDAGNAVVETLLCCADGKAERAADVASFATDSVDMYIQDVKNLNYSDSNFEQKIQNDPFMKREIKNQEDCLILLQKHDSLNQQVIDKLKRQQDIFSL